jgi:hypothetical protein
MKCKNCGHKLIETEFYGLQHDEKINDNFCYAGGNVGIGYCGCRKPELNSEGKEERKVRSLVIVRNLTRHKKLGEVGL